MQKSGSHEKNKNFFFFALNLIFSKKTMYLVSVGQQGQNKTCPAVP